MTEDLGAHSSADTQSSPSAAGTSPMGRMQGQISDRLNATADDLVTRGRDLYEQGNQRRFILEHQGRVMINLPLTVAATIGVIIAVASWPAAVLAALAAFFTRARVRIEEESK